MGLKGFQYPRLLNATSIRLLILHRGNEDQELSASLEIADLDKQDWEYEALSYFWGPPIFPQTIKIDGRHLEITQTLYDAFKRLRLPGEDRTIWADAICIDQNAISEKSHQVTLMSRIYSNCTRAVIYLGLEADGSELVCDFTQELLRCFKQDSSSEDPAWRKRGGIFRDMKSLYKGLPPNDDCRWNAFKAFLRRPWFRRVWVVQEFVLPRDLVIICGHWEVEGTVLPRCLAAFTWVSPLGSVLDDQVLSDETEFREIGTTIVLLPKYLSLRIAVGHHQNSFSEAETRRMSDGKPWIQGRLNMLKLVKCTSWCEVTDPRDQFFGMLGLANDLDDDPSLLPDYSKSLEEVMDAYHAFFVRQGNGSEMLKIPRPPTRSAECGPSWIPNWRNANDKEVPCLRSAKLSQTVITPDPERWKGAVSLINKNALAVAGFTIDRLQYLTKSANQGDLALRKNVVALDKASTGTVTQDSFQKLALSILVNDGANPMIKPVHGDSVDHFEKNSAILLSGNTSNCCKYENFQEESLVQADTKLKDHAEYSGTSSLGEGEQLSYIDYFLRRNRAARFGLTKEGYYGMFPPQTQLGDEIFIIDGGTKTFLIRHRPDTDTYTWLGEIYVYNFEEQIEKAVGHGSPTIIVVT